MDPQESVYGDTYQPSEKELAPTPEHLLKPNLVWLGKFLGMDVYMDVQNVKPKQRELARRLFKAKLGEMN